MSAFHIETARSGQVLTLRLEGSLDVYSSPEFREQLVDLEQSGEPRIGLDLSAVTYLDSTGLGVIIGSHKRLRAQRRELWIVSASQPVRRVLTVLGLEGWLKQISSSPSAS
jgi:anti-sigma B factor antagonist